MRVIFCHVSKSWDSDAFRIRRIWCSAPIAMAPPILIKKNCCTFVVVLNTTDSLFCAPIYITSVKNKYLWFLWPSWQALVETSQFRFGFGKMQIGADLVSTIKPGKTKPYRPVHGSVQENLHSVDPSTRIGNSVVLSRLTRLTRRKTYIEVLNVKVTVFILLLFVSLLDCGQNQTAVSDEQYSLSDF